MKLIVICWSAQAQDSVLAVGALVATHFGARYAQIAWSGAGILVPGGGRVAGGAGARNPTIPELYARAAPSDPTATWAPSSFVPQVRSPSARTGASLPPLFCFTALVLYCIFLVLLPAGKRRRTEHTCCRPACRFKRAQRKF